MINNQFEALPNKPFCFNNDGHVVSDELALSNFSSCVAGYGVDLLSF